jgi:hypothetical protein
LRTDKIDVVDTSTLELCEKIVAPASLLFQLARLVECSIRMFDIP